jgi:hypothetical protein
MKKNPLASELPDEPFQDQGPLAASKKAWSHPSNGLKAPFQNLSTPKEHSNPLSKQGLGSPCPHNCANLDRVNTSHYPGMSL